MLLIPIRIWLIIILSYIVPLIIDKANGEFEWIWFIYLIPSFFFSYYFGLKGGFVSALLSIMTQFTWEFVMNVKEKEVYDPDNYNVFVMVSILCLLIALAVGFLVEKLKCQHKELLSKNLELCENEERYRNLVEVSPNGIIIHDKLGIIRYVNPVGMKILGANALTDLLHKSILDFIHPDKHDQVKKHWSIVHETHKPIGYRKGKMIGLEGQLIDVEVIGLPTTLKGEYLIQYFFRDISDRKRAEKLLYQMAYYDILTGLPNRRLFLERLNQILLDNNSRNKDLSVMFIDLDGFKQINDTLGHDAGDLLLKEVANRLLTCVREEDTVARLAGDEFTILLPNIKQEDTIKVAQSIIKELNYPAIISNHQVNVTSSIGISYYLNNKDDAETLLKEADNAMYQSKKKGKNNYSVYVKSRPIKGSAITRLVDDRVV